MSKVVKHDHKTFFWVGGTDQGHGGEWKWTDGSDWDFKKWATYPIQQPNNYLGQDCLQVYDFESARDGWNDQDCKEKKSFVCSQKVSKNNNNCNNNNSNNNNSNNNNNNNSSNNNNNNSNDNNSNANNNNNNNYNSTRISFESKVLICNDTIANNGKKKLQINSTNIGKHGDTKSKQTLVISIESIFF